MEKKYFINLILTIFLEIGYSPIDIPLFRYKMLLPNFSVIKQLMTVKQIFAFPQLMYLTVSPLFLKQIITEI